MTKLDLVLIKESNEYYQSYKSYYNCFLWCSYLLIFACCFYEMVLPFALGWFVYRISEFV